MAECIGILAVQGAFHKHQQLITRLGYQNRLVRTPYDLEQTDRLIMPGGESTTMRLLLNRHQLWHPLKEYCHSQAVFGTCAGTILLAEAIDNDPEATLGAMAIRVRRNRYGRQKESFAADLSVTLPARAPCDFPALFIRAPQITAYAANKVKVLASWQQDPVLVQQHRLLAATFHPELQNHTAIHRYFLQL